MRVKNDICIKMYQLANTMFLNNEEIGALIRKIMIEDDENEMRYERLDEETKEEFKRCEEKWKREYEELSKKNQMLKMSYNMLRGQTKTSRDAFNRLNEHVKSKSESKKEKTETKKEQKEWYEDERYTEKRKWKIDDSEDLDALLMYISEKEDLRKINIEHFSDWYRDGRDENEKTNIKGIINDYIEDFPTE